MFKPKGSLDSMLSEIEFDQSKRIEFKDRDLLGSLWPENSDDKNSYFFSTTIPSNTSGVMGLISRLSTTYSFIRKRFQHFTESFDYEMIEAILNALRNTIGHTVDEVKDPKITVEHYIGRKGVVVRTMNENAHPWFFEGAVDDYCRLKINGHVGFAVFKNLRHVFVGSENGGRNYILQFQGPKV